MWKTYRMSKTLWPCTSCYHLNFFFLGSNFFHQQSNQTCSCLTSYLLCWRSPSSGFMNSSSSCTFLCGDGVLWVISSSFLSANKGNNLKLKFDVGRPFSPLCLFFDSPSSLPSSQCLSPSVVDSDLTKPVIHWRRLCLHSWCLPCACSSLRDVLVTRQKNVLVIAVGGDRREVLENADLLGPCYSVTVAADDSGSRHRPRCHLRRQS